MQPTTKFSFIDSELPYKDAKELLTELFKYKINFHKVKNFSSIIRYDKTDVDSIQKIEELTKSRDAMMQYLESAKEENRKVTIFSDFQISIK
ncbi:MAG TPA: hypothetical protein PLS10_10745 [Chitinophagales bacterium]|nr:hypothetical protein [Chitinophagales bacterium]